MFFVKYDFTRPEAMQFASNEWLRVTDFDLSSTVSGAAGEQITVFGGEGVSMVGVDADRVFFGSDADDVIDGGDGADIILGDSMTPEDLLSMGVFTEAEVEALSLALDPTGDVEALALAVDPVGDLG